MKFIQKMQNIKQKQALYVDADNAQVKQALDA